MHKNAIVPFIVICAFLAGGILLWHDINKPSPFAAALQNASSTAMVEDAFSAHEAQTPVNTNQQPVVSTANNNQNIMNATFHTNKGDFTIEFFPQYAPKTVENFTKLAQSGFYDGVKFHRVIKGFMIQGGDPLTKDDTMQTRWGTGGPGYTFADEITPDNHNVVGTISMANAGPNTNGSQFFINTNDNSFLDTKHTVFGRVTSGMEVIQAIEETKTNASDRPIEPVIINSISLK